MLVILRGVCQQAADEGTIEGHRLSVDITQEFADMCRKDGLSAGEMIATAMAISAQEQGLDIEDIEVNIGPNPGASDALKAGSVGKPDPRYLKAAKVQS